MSHNRFISCCKVIMMFIKAFISKVLYPFVFKNFFMEINNLKKAVKILEDSSDFTILIPEVRSNLVMASEDPKTPEDIAGIPGRITVVHNRAKTCAEPEYGVSSHMARFVLSIMKHDTKKRSALNIRYDPHLITICQKLGLEVSSYDRNLEPDAVKAREGGTIPWGVETAISKINSVPDVIYHTGGWGKEPMIVLVGENAIEVAEMAVCLAKLFTKL